MRKIFFTSDNHFNHGNIIKYCNRPFKNVDEMDEAMIDNWNDVVSPKDLVYHLGDFTLGNDQVARNIFRRLNGSVEILNNPFHHDKRWLPRGIGWTGFETNGGYVNSIPPLYVLELEGKSFCLCHFPMAVWNKKHYGAIHLYGHSHGNYKYHKDELAIDVGVDNWGFTPVSLEEILERIK